MACAKNKKDRNPALPKGFAFLSTESGALLFGRWRQSGLLFSTVP
jgi:hypothetical protein